MAKIKTKKSGLSITLVPTFCNKSIKQKQAQLKISLCEVVTEHMQSISQAGKLRQILREGVRWNRLDG